MNSKHPFCLIGAGLLVCAGIANASNSTIITLSVDMSAQVANATFVPGTDVVQARGTFSGWANAPLVLTNNPAAANSNLYTGTTNDTVDANSSLMQFKFWDSDSKAGNSGYDQPATKSNRIFQLPSTNGASLVLPTIFFSDAAAAISEDVTNLITFEVDLAQQIHIGNFNTNVSTVEVRGVWENWTGGQCPLTNDPTILRINSYGQMSSNVYVGTFPISGSPGQQEDYKFFINSGPGYESLSGPDTDPYNKNDRFCLLATQTNPIVFFNDAPYAVVATNTVTFQVDMSVEMLRGLFNPPADSVYVRGDFTAWVTGQVLCTNNPEAANTNVYSAVITITNGVGSTNQYKFWSTNPTEDQSFHNGYENPSSTGGQNRVLVQANVTHATLAPVYWSDTPPMSYLPAASSVTFTVDMTGATEYGTNTLFDPTVDSVYLNGDFLGWLGWDQGSLESYEMTNNPAGSLLYSITIPMPPGTNLVVNYRYAMYDGNNAANMDNEAAAYLNHTRYIRTLPNYTLPTDTFGNMFGEPYAFNMLAGAQVWNGQGALGWLGLPGVHLQSSTNYFGPWVDHPETDGANWTSGLLSNNGFVSLTNWVSPVWPVYFRLVQPYIQP
jgi:hypothetical protein